MMQIDDSALNARLDTLQAMLQQLIDAGKVNGTDVPPGAGAIWTTLWHDDFSAYPLGDLPTVWQDGFPWVGANQDGCSTQIVAFQGFKALKCSVTSAYHASQGARAFFHPDSPRWDILVPYVDKVVRLTYRQMFLSKFLLEAGDQLWTTGGVEIKDHDGPAAVAINVIPSPVGNALGSYFALQHYTAITWDASARLVKWGEWFNTELLVKVSKGDDGGAELCLSDGTHIKSLGNTVNPDNGGAAIALCLYGNNIIGGAATCLFTDFRIEVAA